MADPFESSRYHIKHAKRRLDELKRSVVAFLKEEPYALVIEHNEELAQDVYKIVLRKGMPDTWPGDAFDVINSLRSSLDQAGYAVAVAAGRSGANAHFPFGGSESEMLGRAKGRSKDLPKEIFDVMAKAKPYRGGNDLLWSMNRLTNTPKHEVMIAMRPVSPSAFIDEYANPGTTYELGIPPRWDDSKNEMVLFRVAHGDKPRFQMDLHVLIAFTQAEPLRNAHIHAVLDAFVRETEAIVNAIEAEARRLGLVT